MRLPMVFCTAFALVVGGCGGNSEAENDAPVASFSASDEELFAPATVTFDASDSTDADGAIVSYEWNFGDQESATGERVEYVFDSEGDYLVTLTVVDDRGASASSAELIEILPRQNILPVATIAVNQKRGVAPLQVDFSAAKAKDEDGELVSYLWQFADGSTSEDISVTRTYTEPGEYTATLTVTDNDGAHATDEVTLNVFAADASFAIEGTITALPFTDVDGDVNDPFADYFNNDGHDAGAFQLISNPVLLNGFVTDRQTGSAPDRFAFEQDIHDVYQVDLRQGDYVSLEVIDTASADIDLYLLNADSGDIVAFSDGDNQFESVQAPAAGTYLVMVSAELYSSKYLLRVGENSMATGRRAAGKSTDFAADQAIVKFKTTNGQVQAQNSASSSQLALSHTSKSRPALARINRLNPQTRSVLNLQNQHSGFAVWLGAKNPEALAKLETIRTVGQLDKRADIEYAEPNYRVTAQYIPTDPAYIYQWHYPAINLPQAWDVTTGSADVVVAVIDSGVFLSHPDLQGQLLAGYDFISVESYANDGDGIDPDPDDPGDSIHLGGSSWHGTHVSGIVAAAMDNGEGGVGVAPAARVMPLRALGRGGGLAYDILQSVRYAAGMENDSGTLPERAADIINLSLGGSGYSQASQNLYQQVRERGVIVVASAGNENVDEPLYPASYDAVISVAATDFVGERAPYSNRGPFVDVAAPGGLTTADRNSDGYSDGILSASVEETATSTVGGYIFYEGTSMAAPHVSGVAALMKSVYPQLTPDEFDSLLISGAITSDKGTPGRDNSYGYGLIDAQLAVNAAASLAAGASTAAVYADRNIIAFDDSTRIADVEIRAIGSDIIRIIETSVDADWLNVRPLDVDADGVGVYRISVDVTDLADDSYRGFVTFISDRDTEISIQINLRVGQFLPDGDAGLLYVLLIAADSGNVAVERAIPRDGEYEYRFADIPFGEYYVAAGSDIDNDTYVCDAGESCGYYPSLGDFTLIRLDEDKDGIDFSAGLSEGFGTQSTDKTNAAISRLLQ